MALSAAGLGALLTLRGARNWLADKGYDTAYGARTLKRVIQNSQDPLSEEIIVGSASSDEPSRLAPARTG